MSASNGARTGRPPWHHRPSGEPLDVRGGRVRGGLAAEHRRVPAGFEMGRVELQGALDVVQCTLGVAHRQVDLDQADVHLRVLAVSAVGLLHVVEGGFEISLGERHLSPVDVEERVRQVDAFELGQQRVRLVGLTDLLVGARGVGQQGDVLRIVGETALEDLQGAVPFALAEQDDAQVVERLLEIRRQRHRRLDSRPGARQVARQERLGPQVVVVVGGRLDVGDRLEVAVRLGLVGQEVEGRELAVDPQPGDDVSVADHRALAEVPALVVLDLDVEGVEAELARDADEQVDEGQAVAFAGVEGPDRVAGRRQGVLEVEPAEDEVEDLVGSPPLAQRRVEPLVDQSGGPRRRARTARSGTPPARDRPPWRTGRGGTRPSRRSGESRGARRLPITRRASKGQRTRPPSRNSPPWSSYPSAESNRVSCRSSH